MSREETTRQWSYPSSRRLNPFQKAVDFVEGSEVTTKIEMIRGEEYITEIHRGGKWIQLKRMEKPKSLDKAGFDELTNRAKRNVKKAFDLAKAQIEQPKADGWPNEELPDGAQTRTRYELHEPDAFEVRIEIEQFETLPPAEQIKLMTAVEGYANELAPGLEAALGRSIPVAARPTSPPPPSFQPRADFDRANRRIQTRVKPTKTEKFNFGPEPGSPEAAAAKESFATAAEKVVVGDIEAQLEPLYQNAVHEIKLGNNPRGAAVVGGVVFLLVLIAGAAYLYHEAPEGQKLQTVESFGAGVVVYGGLAMAAEKLVPGAGLGLVIGFFAPLESCATPESREFAKRREVAENLVHDAFPKVPPASDEFDKLVEQMMQVTKMVPREVDEPVPERAPVQLFPHKEMNATPIREKEKPSRQLPRIKKAADPAPGQTGGAEQLKAPAQDQGSAGLVRHLAQWAAQHAARLTTQQGLQANQQAMHAARAAHLAATTARHAAWHHPAHTQPATPQPVAPLAAIQQHMGTLIPPPLGVLPIPQQPIVGMASPSLPPQMQLPPVGLQPQVLQPLPLQPPMNPVMIMGPPQIVPPSPQQPPLNPIIIMGPPQIVQPSPQPTVPPPIFIPPPCT